MADHTYHVTSPGRVNLIGGHTDYAGGHVLPLATDLHTRLDATPADRVTVRSAALDEERSFAPDDREPTGSWVDYVKGCYAVLAEAGYSPGGFTGELSGTLPLGSGLSSSASLELAVLALLNEAYDLGVGRERLAEFGQRVENEFVGLNCGIMDQFAVALGRAGHALHVDTETLAWDPVPVPGDLRVLVYHTGRTHELVDSAYNERRETVETALDALGVDSVQLLDEDDLAALPNDQRRRLGYVVREHERVRRARAALADGDAETALYHGAYGARLTGAGWGGAAVALVDAGKARTVARSVHAAYRDRYPDRDPRWYLVTPSDGVSVERSGR